jgi:HEAT repeat protein
MPSAISRRKAAIRNSLAKNNLADIQNWSSADRNPLRALTSLLFDPEALIRWRAVQAIGRISGLIAKNDAAGPQRLIRRLFWMMNDESGNFCAHAPETIGEILYNIPPLITEYAPLLPAFLIEEPFEKGTRIAIARIAEINKSCFNKPVTKKLVQTLKDPDPEIRGASIIALRALGAAEAYQHVKRLADDMVEIEIYDFNIGELIRSTISQLALAF